MKCRKEDGPLSMDGSPLRRSIGCGAIFGLGLAMLCLGGILYWYSASDGQKDAHLEDCKVIAKRFLSFLYTETSQGFINSPPPIPPIGETMPTKPRGELKTPSLVIAPLPPVPAVEKPKPSEAQVLAARFVDSYEEARLHLDATSLSLLEHIPSAEEGKRFYMSQVDAFLQSLDAGLLSPEKGLSAKEIQGFYRQLSQKTKQFATVLGQMARLTEQIAHFCSIEQGKYNDELLDARIAYEKCKKEGVTGELLEEAEARYSIAEGRLRAAQASKDKAKRELFGRLQSNGIEESTLFALLKWAAGKGQESGECLLVASLALKDFSGRLLRKDHIPSEGDPFAGLEQAVQRSSEGLGVPAQQANPVPLVPRQEPLTAEEQLLFDPEIRR